MPAHGLIHNETYQDYSPEQIAEIYRARETEGWKRYMSIPRLKKMIEDSGVENLAQVYTTVKYTRESHQFYSQNVLDYLAKQDFLNKPMP